MVQHIVDKVGLDACGPGRKIEALLKERSGEWGNVYESALLCKALAKRQCRLIKFEKVTVITSDVLGDVTRRVYEHVFSDWKPKLTKLSMRTVPANEEIVARAADVGDDAWYERNSSDYAQHPSMPRLVAAQSPRKGKRDREDD